MSEAAIQQYARIFSKVLPNKQTNDKVPVSWALLDFYQTQQNLLASALTRRHNIEEKNKRIATESMKYRTSLQQKIRMDLEKHSKNREGKLKKIVEAEQRKMKYVKDINNQYETNQKNMFRDRVKEFKQKDEQMINFWQQKQLKRDKAYRSQSAVKPEFEDSVARKKYIEQRNIDLGMQFKSQLLKKHTGRQQIVHEQLKRKSQINEIHMEQVLRNQEKHNEVLTSREQKFINTIGSHFTASEDLLKKNRTQLQKKIKDKVYDSSIKRETIRSNFMDRTKYRATSLAECKCKKAMNNAEQGITKSVVFNSNNDSPESPRGQNKMLRNTSSLYDSRRNFMVRSQSMRSTVNYNQQTIKERKLNLDSKRLIRENMINDSIKLKKKIEVEGNCYVRLQNVK